MTTSPSPPPSVSVLQRLRLTRHLLPPLIVLVVVLYELFATGLSSGQAQFWAHLAFYGVLGPLVTFFTLQWLEKGVLARELAERELRRLYRELRASHQQLDTVQSLIRTLAEAADLEQVLDAAVSGAQRALGAVFVRLQLSEGLERAVSEGTLLVAPSADLHEVRLALTTGSEATGRLTLHFEQAPSPDTLRLAGALAAEIGTAVEAARRRTQDLITLYQVDQSIRAERNMRRLLERVTQNMAVRIGAAARAVYLTDEDGVLRHVWSRDSHGEVSRKGYTPDFVKRTAASGQAVVATSDEARQVFESASAALGLAMRDDAGIVGVIVLGDTHLNAFESVRVPLLALLANQATLAIRNARAYLYSEELAIGEERARIAREIHDGVAQSLAFCALKLDVVERLISKNSEQAVHEVQVARTILREQIREVRRSIFALRPIDLERFGLLETLRRYVQDFGEQNSIRTHLSIEGDINLAPSDEAIVFRILQESLNNVAKHAKAREVWVTLTGGDTVELEVKDDGQGFDFAQLTGRVSSAGGLGLAQMKERIESRGGHYTVLSECGSGTSVRAQLPIA
ncbi:GAF domain-containing sensor histidine kinase [Deinococcus yavapaiensis]|uniref:GAF domain-containing sensor histidine kinase n=1 Tax=Deinococcus yavapaiensis TaxID=309889 RepID=UPI000DA1274A|nr:GAF domain-containing sensor histidine kinase [Deinococcus yavapaiensis]